MHLRIDLNPKHESDRILSFIEVVRASGNKLTLVFGPEDLIKKGEDATFELARDALKAPDALAIHGVDYLIRIADEAVYQDDPVTLEIQ